MEFKYKAFISYRRTKRDSAVAQALQQMLEQYVIPPEFCEKGQNKLGAIFRDRTHIDADPSLRRILYDALDSSEYLIVICSEDIMDPEHPWVLEEIRYFLNSHPDARNRILTVFAGDDPEASIPRLLWMQDGAHEPELPNYVDIHGRFSWQRRRNLRDQLPSLCTSLLSIKNDKLAMREKNRRRKRNAVVAALLSLVLGYLLWSNIQIDGKNRELEQTNQALEQQINERLLRESELLTQSSVQALASGDQHTAIRDAVDALPSPDSPRPYYAPAEQALYDALDIFNLSSINHVLRDTVFEHTSAVEDLCFSSDGTKLFTATSGGSVSCFDVVSGTLLWTQTPSSYFIDLPCLFLCEAQGSILTINNSSISSLDMDTGEVLWDLEDLDYPEQVELSDDGSCFARWSYDDCFGAMMLTCISTTDGSVLCTFPADTNDGYIYSVTIDIFDFSSDGRYFAGCLSSSDESGHDYTTVFLADVTTGDVRLLSPQQCPGTMRPCSVEFTDQDRTVTVIHYEYNSYFFYRVQKLRVSDGKLLWQTETPEQDFDYYPIHWDYTDWLHQEEHLLLGIQHQLYALDMETGKLFDTEHLSSRLRYLQILDQNCFALVLEDGTYRTGEVSDGGLRLHESLSSAYDQSSVMNLGPNLNACLGNKGYLRAGDANTQAISVISSDDRGFCSAAFVPQDNDWQVIVRQAVPFDPPLEKKSLNADALLDCYYFEIGFCDADTFYMDDLSYEGHTIFLDRRTFEQTEPVSEIVRLHDSKLIYETVFYQHNSTLLADNSVLIAIPTEYGIRLRLDGKPLPDAKYPDTVQGEPIDDIIPVGRNGYIQPDGQTPPGTFCLYDIRTQKWHTIAIQTEACDDYLTCLGETKPTFTVIDQNGILRTYDIPSGEEIQHIDTGLHHNSFAYIQWIMDDRYILARANSLQYFFLDGTTGEVLFRYTAKTDSHVYFPNFISDPQRNRFFIWDDIGVCIDTENWAVLTEIPGMELYDPVSGMLFYQDTSTNTGFEEYISAIRLPTTEELVAIAKAYLGE